jgi:hypothetical protein
MLVHVRVARVAVIRNHHRSYSSSRSNVDLTQTDEGQMRSCIVMYFVILDPIRPSLEALLPD